MTRRSRAGDKPVKARRRTAVTPKRGAAPKAVGRHRTSTASQEAKTVRLARERDEALEQLSAASDVLKVISSSPGNLKSVFESILKNATRICQANFGVLFLCEGDFYRTVAMHNAPSVYVETRQREPLVSMASSTLLGEVARIKRAIQTSDLSKEPAYRKNPQYTQLFVRLTGARSFVAVPILKENNLVGVVAIYRQEVRPFTEKQIALVQNFAAQAVIAIENTRLLNELRQRTTDLTESLEQQTATSEVLSVISSSPGELEPVFKAMLENATRICDAKHGFLFRAENDDFRIVASSYERADTAEETKQRTFKMGPSTPIGRARLTRQIVHVPNLAEDQAYLEGEPLAVWAVEQANVRTVLVVPMLKEEEFIGVFGVHREEVKPFTDKQIALVQNFAAQAVIAIENTRLLSELRQRTDDLSKSLDDLRTAQDRLVQTQKLASLGQLTAGIAHEIKNPLNFVNNFSGVSIELIDELQETLRGGKLDDKARSEIVELADTLRGNLDKIVQHGQRADSIVKNMLLHSREGSGEHRPVDINALVEESLNLAYHGARAEKQGFTITLERSFDPAAGEVDVFPQDITRVLLNLIANGFYAATKRQAQANGDGYEPILTASTKSLGDSVEIIIHDNGTGISPEVREKMFNPFFTTKPAGEGTGLGLSISHDIIVKQHAGSIEVDTQPGKFTEFKIVLPRTSASIGK